MSEYTDETWTDMPEAEWPEGELPEAEWPEGELPEAEWPEAEWPAEWPEEGGDCEPGDFDPGEFDPGDIFEQGGEGGDIFQELGDVIEDASGEVFGEGEFDMSDFAGQGSGDDSGNVW